MELRSNAPSGDIETSWDRHRFDMKLVNPANKRKFNVIVVGTGLAGASASATLAWPAGIVSAGLASTRARLRSLVHAWNAGAAGSV